MTSELIPFKSADELAESAASDWLKQLRSRNPSTPYSVALSGGRIARRFYLALAGSACAKDFLSVHFFWGDERCVPPDDPESNFGLAYETLFKPLGIPEPQIHRIRGEAPPEGAAVEAEKELQRIAPGGPDGQPILDLVFLGMGEDGHVASLFPGESEETMASQAVFRPVFATKPPPRRITLGYPAIAAARQVWVLASAKGKMQALRESLAPDSQTPLGRVLRLRQQTRVLESVTSDR